MDTETLDKLYLEWSQFTHARTAREIAMKTLLSRIGDELSIKPAPANLAKLQKQIYELLNNNF